MYPRYPRYTVHRLPSNGPMFSSNGAARAWAQQNGSINHSVYHSSLPDPRTSRSRRPRSRRPRTRTARSRRSRVEHASDEESIAPPLYSEHSEAHLHTSREGNNSAREGISMVRERLMRNDNEETRLDREEVTMVREEIDGLRRDSMGLHRASHHVFRTPVSQPFSDPPPAYSTIESNGSTNFQSQRIVEISQGQEQIQEIHNIPRHEQDGEIQQAILDSYDTQPNSSRLFGGAYTNGTLRPTPNRSSRRNSIGNIPTVWTNNPAIGVERGFLASDNLEENARGRSTSRSRPQNTTVLGIFEEAQIHEAIQNSLNPESQVRNPQGWIWPQNGRDRSETCVPMDNGPISSGEHSGYLRCNARDSFVRDELGRLAGNLREEIKRQENSSRSPRLVRVEPRATPTDGFLDARFRVAEVTEEQLEENPWSVRGFRSYISPDHHDDDRVPRVTMREPGSRGMTAEEYADFIRRTGRLHISRSSSRSNPRSPEERGEIHHEYVPRDNVGIEHEDYFLSRSQDHPREHSHEQVRGRSHFREEPISTPPRQLPHGFDPYDHGRIMPEIPSGQDVRGYQYDNIRIRPSALRQPEFDQRNGASPSRSRSSSRVRFADPEVTAEYPPRLRRLGRIFTYSPDSGERQHDRERIRSPTRRMEGVRYVDRTRSLSPVRSDEDQGRYVSGERRPRVTGDHGYEPSDQDRRIPGAYPPTPLPRSPVNESEEELEDLALRRRLRAMRR